MESICPARPNTWSMNNYKGKREKEDGEYESCCRLFFVKQ